jgi:micrococcal nuclease
LSEGFAARSVLPCWFTSISLSLTFALTLGVSPAFAVKGLPVTCKALSAVDGDTIKCDGVNMRDMGDGAPFVSGYDTPEISKSKCAAEKALGRQAKRRMAQMLKTPGLKIYNSGEDDGRYKRPLVWVILPDGRSVGSVLIKEGLASVWTPDYKPNWCPTTQV